MFDMRDLAKVFAHVHDAEIEISEGSEPPRRGSAIAVKAKGIRAASMGH
jgi:hypothetical protein